MLAQHLLPWRIGPPPSAKADVEMATAARTRIRRFMTFLPVGGPRDAISLDGSWSDEHPVRFKAARLTLKKYSPHKVAVGFGGLMYRVLTCLGGEHDWRLVIVAGVVCFLASLTAISLFGRARATESRGRI